MNADSLADLVNMAAELGLAPAPHHRVRDLALSASPMAAGRAVPSLPNN
jgi:hypothetical protein